jgi:uncharacterized membrane protein
MLLVRPASSYQSAFLGLLLLLLFMLWQRAAVLLYALHMGVRPFPGFDDMVAQVFTTPMGLSLIITGTAVGGLFAAFAFAVSVFAVPMMLEERTDALTAMGISLALVWNNLEVMLAWAAIVVGALRPVGCHRISRPDRSLPGARPRHLACLPRHPHEPGRAGVLLARTRRLPSGRRGASSRPP